METKFIFSVILIFLSLHESSCNNPILNTADLCIKSNECHGRLAYTCGQKFCSIGAKKCQTFLSFKKAILFNTM